MTVVQIRSCPADPAPVGTVSRAASGRRGRPDAAGSRGRDDMTVEVALSVMAGARTERLLVCDDDGEDAHVVTRAQLTAVRDGSTYTDRARLREVPGGSGPLAAPGRRPRPGAGRPAPLNRLTPGLPSHPFSCEVSCAVSSPASPST
ncbi:CBS domain-containing protein [Streptomyces sp. NPDC018045]|uniref:CBS domain-containing protein n=1 Tax=Streptomyces sp. NPDC018045 TaxID=3365037 RepID=UPI00379C786B